MFSLSPFHEAVDKIKANSSKNASVSFAQARSKSSTEVNQELWLEKAQRALEALESIFACHREKITLAFVLGNSSFSPCEVYVLMLCGQDSLTN
jgi:hypothetical protein